MEFTKKEVKIFLLSGKARSGKETVSNMIKDYYSNKKVIDISFAGYLKEYAKKISNWDGSEATKARELLQQLGIELIKEKIDDELFIRRVLEDIEIYSYFFDVIIITDARLVHEFESIKEHFSDVVTIKLERNNYNDYLTEEEKNHITEREISEYNNFDYIIENRGFQDLRNSAVEVVRNEENYGG